LVDSGIEGLRDSGIQGLRDWGIEGFRDWGIEGLRDWGIEGFRDSGIQGFRSKILYNRIYPLIPKFLNSQFLNHLNPKLATEGLLCSIN
jgi:hypothetical protein